MKIDEHLLKFPAFLPNDLEGFVFTYPKKFPQVVNDYEEVVKKVATDSDAYEAYGYWVRKELIKGFEKIETDYRNGDQDDLNFLIETDQRINKLFCFRFWIVNYLFADGPLHDFFVENLKTSIRKFIDVTEDIEDFEEKVLLIQRDLLQSDYADLYLQQALSGVKIVGILKENLKTNSLLTQAVNLIDQDPKVNLNQINKIWDEIIDLIESTHSDMSALKKELEIPLVQAEMRNSRLPIYNMLTHSVEYREANEVLEKRHREMKQKIDGYFTQAKEKLTVEEFDIFETSYKQCRNFAIFKDIMGEIDGPLLPLWFGIHDKIRDWVLKNLSIKLHPAGHASIFYQLVWYLPDHLKAKIFTIDSTPFDLKTI